MASPPPAPVGPDTRPLLTQLLCPREVRKPGWLRWLRISTRTAHVLCIAGLLGAVLFDAGDDGFRAWLLPVVGTGLVMVATFAYETFAWFTQLAGLVMLAKLAALITIALMPPWRLPVLVGLVIVSSFSSHMPGRIRHWVLPGMR